MNIRVQKEFVIKDTQRIQLMFNVFNVADAKTVTAVYTLTGRPLGIRRTPSTEPSSDSACATPSRPGTAFVYAKGSTRRSSSCSSAHSCVLNSEPTPC